MYFCVIKGNIAACIYMDTLEGYIIVQSYYMLGCICVCMYVGKSWVKVRMSFLYFYF